MTPEQIIKHFGGRPQAAKALGYHRQTIYDWLKAKAVPPRTQAWIQLQTDGALKAEKAKRA